MSIDPELITRETVIQYVFNLSVNYVTYKRIVTDVNEPPMDKSKLAQMGNEELVSLAEQLTASTKELKQRHEQWLQLSDEQKERVRKCFTYDLPSVPFPVETSLLYPHVDAKE